MNRDEVERKVIELAAKQVGVDPATVFPATHFVNDLAFDSLDAMDFAMNVEDEWDVSIPDDEEGAKLVTVELVVDFVLKNREAQAAA